MNTSHPTHRPCLGRLAEHLRTNTAIHQATLFPLSSAHRVAALTHGGSPLRSATLSFRFGSVNYAKGRVLPFFIAIELLTGQKGVATLSRRAVPARKVRKGGLVGCRVTLRRRALNNFLETLGVSFPRIERLTPPRWTARFRSAIPLGKGQMVASLSSFRFNELVAFPPLERGLGLHPDVHTRYLSVHARTRAYEELYFALRTAKLPVL